MRYLTRRHLCVYSLYNILQEVNLAEEEEEDWNVFKAGRKMFDRVVRSPDKIESLSIVPKRKLDTQTDSYEMGTSEKRPSETDLHFKKIKIDITSPTTDQKAVERENILSKIDPLWKDMAYDKWQDLCKMINGIKQ